MGEATGNKRETVVFTTDITRSTTDITDITTYPYSETRDAMRTMLLSCSPPITILTMRNRQEGLECVTHVVTDVTTTHCFVIDLKSSFYKDRLCCVLHKNRTSRKFLTST